MGAVIVGSTVAGVILAEVLACTSWSPGQLDGPTSSANFLDASSGTYLEQATVYSFTIP